MAASKIPSGTKAVLLDAGGTLFRPYPSIGYYYSTVAAKYCCLVPEKRSERTTEGGLDVIGGHDHLRIATSELGKVGIRVSLFIEPSAQAVEAACSIGAPVIEPPGKVAKRQSMGSIFFLSKPVTVETRWKTLAYLSKTNASDTFTDPYSHILPRSFLSRSTIMICSALSFGLWTSSFSKIESLKASSPLGLVPFIGLVSI